MEEERRRDLREERDRESAKRDGISLKHIPPHISGYSIIPTHLALHQITKTRASNRSTVNRSNFLCPKTEKCYNFGATTRSPRVICRIFHFLEIGGVEDDANIQKLILLFSTVTRLTTQRNMFFMTGKHKKI